MGLLCFMLCTADEPEWAHRHIRLLLPMASFGPFIFFFTDLFFPRCAVVGSLDYAPAGGNGFSWAQISSTTCFRCARVVTLVYTLAAADVFAWADSAALALF